MKNNLFKGMTVSILLASFVLSPAFAFAKDNNGKDKGNGDSKIEVKIEKKEKDNDDKNEDNKGKKETKCWRALGHFIAPGWIKNNGPLTIGTNCYLPFGIAKKFRNTTGTSTPDTIAPIISNVSATTSNNQAIITWKTNENANSAVFYQTSASVDTQSSTTLKVLSNNNVKNHSLTLSGLSASTTYYFKVVSKDPSGNSSTSSEMTFVTKPTPSVVDTKAPVISNVVAVVSTSSASVFWGTDELATSKVYYSTSTPLDISSSTTNFVESASSVLSHVVGLTGLSTSTKYYVVVESRDSSLNTQRSAEFSFTTQN